MQPKPFLPQWPQMESGEKQDNVAPCPSAPQALSLSGMPSWMLCLDRILLLWEELDALSQGSLRNLELL